MLRDLTGGHETAAVQGAKVRELIDALDARYPGIKARLVAGEELRPGIVLTIDGVTSRAGLREPVSERSEVHFLPAIGGGSGQGDSVTP